MTTTATEQEALAQTAVMTLPDPPAEIIVPADVLATTVEVVQATTKD